MMRDEIKKIVEGYAQETANKIADLIEQRLQVAMGAEPVVRKNKGGKKTAKANTGIQLPTFTTGGDSEEKRKYTKTPKAIAASVRNIAKAREARLAKLREEKAKEVPAPVAVQ